MKKITIRDEFKNMNTRQLLAQYRECRFEFNSDLYDEEYIEIHEQEMTEMKAELDTREHIPNKIEAKKIRQR